MDQEMDVSRRHCRFFFETWLTVKQTGQEPKTRIGVAK